MAKNRTSTLTVSRFRAQGGQAVGRLNIYGDIEAGIINGDEVTPHFLLSQLEALGPIQELEVHIFSNGGDVFAGLAIYKMLKEWPAPVTAYVEGIAASIATVILCAADRVYMGPTDMLMIHDPMGGGARGIINANQARALADELDRIRGPMIAAYMAKTGRTEEEVVAVMDGTKGSGTWLSPDDAIEFGLADGYTPDAKRPPRAAARIRPGVLAMNGHTVDLRRYPGATKYTSKLNKQRKGVSVPMAKPKNRNTRFPFMRRRAELEMIEMVCPHCAADVLLNPESGEVALVSTGEDGHVEQVLEGGVEARRSGSFRAQVFDVTCPHCGGEFVWDTDGQDAGNEGEPVIPTVEVGESYPPEEMGAVARRGGKPTRRVVARKPTAKGFWSGLRGKTRAEIQETSCPVCAAQVPYDPGAVEVVTDENGVEGYALVCAECGTQFIEPLSDTIPDAIPMDAVAAYRQGVVAERRRMLALDEMAEAAPGCESMIRAAKRAGSSAQVMSTNVFKAMSNNPAVAGRQRQAAIGRDARAAGINGIPAPSHYSPKNAYVNGVLTTLDNR